MSTAPTTSAVNRRGSSTSKRLFTQKDEINLLKSLLNSSENPILDGNYSETQIKHKIARLKQKYQKQAKSNTSSIKTSHDRKIYEISRKIWGPEETSDEKKEDSKSTMINWSDYPFLMRQVSGAFSGCEEIYKQGLKGLGEDVLKGLDKKWMEIEMEGAAIQAKKAQLVHNQLKSILKGNN